MSIARRTTALAAVVALIIACGGEKRSAPLAAFNEDLVPATDFDEPGAADPLDISVLLDALEAEDFEVFIFAPGPAPAFVPLGGEDPGAGVVTVIVVSGDRVAQVSVLRYSNVAAADADWLAEQEGYVPRAGSTVAEAGRSASSVDRVGNLILLTHPRPPRLAEGFHYSEDLEGRVLRAFESLE